MIPSFHPDQPQACLDDHQQNVTMFIRMPAFNDFSMSLFQESCCVYAANKTIYTAVTAAVATTETTSTTTTTTTATVAAAAATTTDTNWN